ncbi:hypothetical protein MPER_04992 [Moniliophthora perniciosa FA553]|nr:hypothetical protein MPER_04992 [Moniliophthora perniciosa FA553]
MFSECAVQSSAPRSLTSGLTTICEVGPRTIADGTLATHDLGFTDLDVGRNIIVVGWQ